MTARPGGAAAELRPVVGPAATDEAPFPPRERRLRRTVLAVVVLSAGLVAFHLTWGWYAERRLQAEIARIVAAGEPIELEDFDRAAVPDEENMAVALDRAAEETKLSAFQQQVVMTLLDRAPRRPVSQNEQLANRITALGEIVALNEDSLRTADRAVSRPECQWWTSGRAQLLSWVGRDPLPRLDWGYVQDAAVLHHAITGDVEACLARLRASRRIAQRMMESGLYLDGVVAGRWDHPVRVIVYSLQLRDAAPDRGPASVLHPDAVADMIEMLLDEEAEWTYLPAALHELRARRLHYLREVLAGNSAVSGFRDATWPAPSTWERWTLPLVRPAWTTQALLLLERDAALIDAARRRDADALVPAEYVRPHNPYGSFDAFIRPLSGSSGDYLLRVTVTLLAERRLLATALAARWCELEQGELPESLEALVPRYLERIPVDPFSPVGAAVGYVNDERPRVYSIGADRVDACGVGRRRRSDEPTVHLHAADR